MYFAFNNNTFIQTYIYIYVYVCVGARRRGRTCVKCNLIKIFKLHNYNIVLYKWRRCY